MKAEGCYVRQNAIAQQDGSLLRSGFTLLEIILATFLLAILMIAVSAAVSQYSRLEFAGRIESERVQVARSFLRQFETDLRSVTFPSQPSPTDDSATAGTASTGASGTSAGGATGGSGSTGSSGSGGSGSGAQSSSSSSTSASASSSSTTTTISVDSPEDELGKASWGVRGSGNQIFLQISRPQRAVSSALPSAGAIAVSRTSDLRNLSYFAQPGSGGIMRSELDRMAGDAALQKGNTSVVVAGATSLVPEVQTLLFEYFDGTSWRASWDSAASARLPRAVRVTLKFMPQVNRYGSLWNSGVSPSTDIFQHVFAVPLADPSPPETL